MGYRFFSRPPQSLELEGLRLAHLKEVSARHEKRLRSKEPQGLARFDPLRDLIERGRRLGRVRKAGAGSPVPPSAAVIATSRLGFGPRPGDIAAFNALGANPTARLTAWVDQQLDPDSIDDTAADARIAQSGFTTLSKSLPQLWIDHMINYIDWENHTRPFRETELQTFLKAIFSKRQLFEVMVDFWHNHFNVYGNDFAIAATWPHTDRDAIRPHALGNFRQMLEANARTPAMLMYLDNQVNSFEDANENYARELMELHTLGAHSYLGNLPANQVPTLPNGTAEGYVEDDVVEVARALTGWTVSNRDWDPQIGNTGEFLYYDPWHDHQPKTILANDLPADQPPMKDGQDLFDILASHPSTGQFIATKLCRRLLADIPPTSVVQAAAQTFTDNWQAPDQIAQTIRTIVLSPEFLQTWGEKVRRPLEITVAAFRGCGGDLPFEIGEGATDWFRWMYYQTGQPLFGWHPPNGYPDFVPAWNSTAPRVRCWRMANFCVQVDDGAGNFYFDLLGQTPGGVRSAREIVDYWSNRLFGRPAPADEYDELLDFMAQGFDPDVDLPLATDEATQDRLRTLVALMMMCPSFIWR